MYEFAFKILTYDILHFYDYILCECVYKCLYNVYFFILFIIFAFVFLICTFFKLILIFFFFIPHLISDQNI